MCARDFGRESVLRRPWDWTCPKVALDRGDEKSSCGSVGGGYVILEISLMMRGSMSAGVGPKSDVVPQAETVSGVWEVAL